jgi:hypothetical protein
MEIETIAVPVTTTGSAGSASGSATTRLLRGELLDVFLDYHGAPATSDVTIAYGLRGGTILAVANANTDALIAPRQKLVDNANAAIADSHAPFPLDQPLTISVAGADAADPAVTVYLRVRRP